MSYDSDLEKIRKKSEQQGWRYKRTEGGHHQFYSPDKETIVTAAGTPGDQRGWLNFLADMKRGGYRDDFRDLSITPVGPIGIALLEAKGEPVMVTAPPKEVPKAPEESDEEDTVSVAEHVRSLLRNNPQQEFHLDDIYRKIKAVSKKATKVNVSQICVNSVRKGRFRRVGEIGEKTGKYQWVGEEKVARRSKKVNSGSLVDDSGDLDLKQLDEALAALGKIEEVVRRTKEKITLLQQFKQLMGN